MRAKILLTLVVLVFSVSVSAQNGAVLERGQMHTFWAEWDGETFAAFATSNALYNICGLETDGAEAEWTIITLPSDIVKFRANGNYMTRVYSPMSPGEFFSDPCWYWQNGPMIAEGIVHSNFYHNNGRNVDGYTFSGTLYDLTPTCPSGMVDLNIIRKWKYDKKLGGWVDQVIKGPRLSCVE